MPGVKSFAQQGFAEFEAPTWWALLGRAGTPEPILRRMAKSVQQILPTPEIRDRIEEQGADVGGRRAGALPPLPQQPKSSKWGQVIRDNNITAGKLTGAPPPPDRRRPPASSRPPQRSAPI